MNTYGLLLSWNSLPTASYHVQARSNISQANWINLSDAIIASDTTTSWIDTTVHTASGRCYRIASP